MRADPKTTTLRTSAIGRKNLGRVAQFLERPIHQLEVARAHLVARHFERGDDQFLDQLRRFLRAPVRDQLPDPALEFRPDIRGAADRLIHYCAACKIFHAAISATLGPADRRKLKTLGGLQIGQDLAHVPNGQRIVPLPCDQMQACRVAAARLTSRPVASESCDPFPCQRRTGTWISSSGNPRAARKFRRQPSGHRPRRARPGADFQSRPRRRRRRASHWRRRAEGV